MVLNRLCNRWTGRGFETATSTRNPPARDVSDGLLMGVKWDRRTLKDSTLYPALYHRYRAKSVVANDNYAEARLAA